MVLILLGLFNGLVFLPVLLVMVGPPAQVTPTDDTDKLPPATPEVPTVRFRSKPARLESSNRSQKSCQGERQSSHRSGPKRHNSDISLSTIAEETHSHGESVQSNSSYEQTEPNSVQNSLNGTSVFLEPHITVETSTVPHNVSYLFCILLSPRNCS